MKLQPSGPFFGECNVPVLVDLLGAVNIICSLV